VSGKFDNRDYWLKIGAETRAAAAGMSDPYSKRTLLLIAERYATLAERAERRGEQKGALESA